jgi:UDP-N-acetyl-D-mannosaminuronic acid dehydrogenase
VSPAVPTPGDPEKNAVTKRARVRRQHPIDNWNWEGYSHYGIDALGKDAMAFRTTIVGGCGHVGLPLGIALANAGAEVALYDTQPDRVAEVSAGKMPFLEWGAEPELAGALASGRLTATTDPASIAPAEVVIVTIGTPVDEFLDPKVRMFDRAIRGLHPYFRPGQLLVLRSTVFPGMTDRLVDWLAEAGPAVDVAFCPERIAQGHALRELSELPQIVSGSSPAAVRRATAFFKLLTPDIVELPPIEAELAKLFANTFRYINFAVSNQLYLIARKFNADFARIHAAVTYKYPRLAGFPKAGFAGGPCLLKDTMQLAGFNHNTFPIGQAAMMVNEGLPSALVEYVKASRDLSSDRAAILGMAFKGNCDDHRDSLAYKLRKILTLECREVFCTDPYIADPSFVTLETALAKADVIFLGACHAEYKNLRFRQPVIDVFDYLPKEAAGLRRAA